MWETTSLAEYEREIVTAFGPIKTWDHPTKEQMRMKTYKVTDSAILSKLPAAVPGFEWHYINTPVDPEHGDYAISKLGITYPYDECLPLADKAQASGVVAGSGVVYRLIKRPAPYKKSFVCQVTGSGCILDRSFSPHGHLALERLGVSSGDKIKLCNKYVSVTVEELP